MITGAGWQWAPPTSLVLDPGQGRNYTLRFTLADDVRSIDAQLLQRQRPVANAVPG